MLTVLHGSDVHFGRPHRPSVATAFLEMVRTVAPDVIILAGTSRSGPRYESLSRPETSSGSFRMCPCRHAREPRHPPLTGRERLFAPFRNYRAVISEELDTVTRVGGAVLVALNSVEPHRGLVNGRIEDRQLRFLARIFQETFDADVRIVVTHHALAPPPDGGSDATLPGSGVLLDRFRELGVDLVLSGHLHRGFVTRSSEVRPGHRGHGDIAIVHSGTAASSRGRVAEKGENSVNVLRVGTEKIEVIPHWFEKDRSEFVAREPMTIWRIE